MANGQTAHRVVTSKDVIEIEYINFQIESLEEEVSEKNRENKILEDKLQQVCSV